MLLLLAACSTDEGATRPTGPVIDRIEIQGTEKVEPDAIKEKILTTESPWYTFLPFTEKERFDPNSWQADLRRIERYYEAQGYYQAEVLEDRIIPRGTDSVSLMVRVREGDPTTIGELNISGMDALPPEVKASALKELPLQAGKIFYEEDWLGVKGTLTSRLKEAGYAEATVEGTVEVDIATRQAKVTLTVAPGQRYNFGNIFVAAGARPKVAQKWIIDQVEEEVVPGERYSETALADGQARVFNMGVFGAVKVNRGAPDREAGTVPVVVDVREAPFHTIKLGGGGGVDLARNEIRAVAEYTDRNFFGGLRRLTTRAKVGYAFIPDVVTVGRGDSDNYGIILDSLAELEQPRLFGSPNLRGQATVGVERGIEPAYSFWGGRTKLGLIWQPHPAFSVFPSFNLEGYLIRGQAQLSSDSPSLVVGCGQKGPDTPCFLTYLEQVVQWERRDNPQDPRHGYYLSLALQQAGLTDFTYLRVVPDVRGYLSFLDNKLTVAGKIRLGALYPFAQKEGELTRGGPDDSPITNRFFSGGGNSHRGFNNRRLSPIQIVPPPPKSSALAFGEAIPIGGNGLVESSFEVRYNLSGDWVLATFLDAGLVTREALDFGRIPQNLQYAVGIGFRYRTLVGPIRVDLARRLPFGPPLQVANPGTPYPTDNSCFGLFGSSASGYSGSPEGLCTFHLSIGEAF